ncbi:uncharacterized protein LOC110862258 [Folsomia candida]|uniref:Protein ref(2)P n=1 Tax=Folsomia candida TaxID=158441 RepID=A0A226D0K7_FOLCA|nr:uncharacterized protein LOC110862258 [Folsomia candida]OXA37826.1 Protein ref(2)P [Folsomia candida]
MESVKLEHLGDHVKSKHTCRECESSKPTTFQILQSLPSPMEMTCLLRGYKVIIWEPIFIVFKSRQSILAVTMKLFKPKDGVDRNRVKIGWKILQVCGTEERHSGLSFSVVRSPSEENPGTFHTPEIKWKGHSVVQGWKLTDDEPNISSDNWMETPLSSLIPVANRNKTAINEKSVILLLKVKFQRVDDVYSNMERELPLIASDYRDILLKGSFEFPKFSQVSCDICKAVPIKGSRFKCTVCNNFDLCESCARKGLHSEHDMIRMMFPIPTNGEEYAEYLLETSERVESEGVVSHPLVCETCNVFPSKGSIFLCLVCSLHICGDCEANGIHNWHWMLRVTQVLNEDRRQYIQKASVAMREMIKERFEPPKILHILCSLNR